MSLALLRATVYAHYISLAYLVFVYAVPIPYPKGPLALCGAASLAGTIGVHAWAVVTGRWRRAAYLLFALDQATTLPAIALTGFVASPFLIILPFALFSVYYIAYDIRLTIRYGVGCVTGLAALFAVWWWLQPDTAGWPARSYPAFTFALFLLQIWVLGVVVYQSGFLPNPIVEELNRQEAELERQGRRAELGTALSQITHEIRNPLSTVTLSLDLIGEELKGIAGPRKARALRHAQTCLAELDRIHAMLESILSYAREKQGQYHFGVHPIRGLLDRALEFLRLKYGRHRVSFGVILGMLDADSLWCDRDAMHQVLVNLLDNAIQHRSPDRPLQIEFRVHNRNGTLALTVRDNGVGIPADRLPRIFEKFHTGRPDGTGLGLSVVRHLLQDHGGTIEAHSTPGIGTTFSLYLPAGVPAVPANAPLPAVTGPLPSPAPADGTARAGL